MVRRAFSLVLFFCACLGLANDASIMVTGSASNYKKNKQIQMVKEEVRIKMGDEKSHVNVTFWFKNTGAATKVMMGFPEESYGDAAKKVIFNFKSTVDGKMAKVTRMGASKSNGDAESLQAMWVKEVSFSKGGLRKVVVDYDALNGGSVSGDTNQRYLFTSGATWSGKIGSIKIWVDWSSVRKSPFCRPILEIEREGGTIPEYRPEKWSHTAAKVLYTEVKNVKPDFNLMTYLTPGPWNFIIDGKSVPFEYGLMTCMGPWWPKVEDGALWVPTNCLSGIFGAQSEGQFWVSFGHPIGTLLDGDKEMKVDGNRFTAASGKTYTLLHAAKVEKISEDMTIDYIRIDDLMAALGGSASFDPATNTAHIKSTP